MVEVAGSNPVEPTRSISLNNHKHKFWAAPNSLSPESLKTQGGWLQTGECSLSGIISITINNWEKHNPKRDQKTYTWLRLNNDISTDPELFGLDAEQRYCWIEILCQASRKNSGTISINLDQIADVTKVAKAKILKLINFLLVKPIIIIHDRALPSGVVTTTPTYERTNVRDERTNETNEDIAPTKVVAEASHPEELLNAHEFLKSRNIKPSLSKTWLQTFNEPEWIIQELKKANAWEEANPRKKKKDFGKFMTNWLTRGWDTRRLPSTNNRASQRTENNRAAADEYMKKLRGGE